MQEKDYFENIYFVIVEPKGDRNIGSICRVMANMGFSNLVLVNPVPYLTVEGYRMAASAKDFLDRIVIYDTLEEAIKDSNLVICTTGKTGKEKKSALSPEEVADLVLSMGSDTKISIVFGREDRGLENKELRYAHFLSRIPTSKKYPSLNLSHAVLIYAYEILKKYYRKEVGEKKEHKPATQEEIEGFYQHMKNVLMKLKYLDPQNPDRIMDVLRKLYGRAMPDSREVRILRGILRKMDNFIEGKMRGKNGIPQA